MQKLDFICFPQSQNRKPWFLISLHVGLGLARTCNLALTSYSIALASTSYLRHFTWLKWGDNQHPPPSSHCPVGGVLMVKSDYETWVQTERSPVFTCCHMDLWLYCGSHLIIVISNNLTTSSSPGKIISCFFHLDSQFAHSATPWLPKAAYELSRECLWPLPMQSSLPAWL